jgi:hypothetical protein
VTNLNIEAAFGLCTGEPFVAQKEQHMDAALMAVTNELLRGEVGSGLHGTGQPGHDDRDEMGVCIEPPTHVLGLSGFEQYIWRGNIATGERKKEGERSYHGDLDLCIYSLRKFVRLAAKGNPSILALLFVPPSHLVKQTPLGEELQRLAPSIVSRQAGARYLGYMRSQRDRLLGLRGGHHGGKARPELIEAYGFEKKLIWYADGTAHVRSAPDYHAINEFLVRAYTQHWAERGMI